MNTCFTETKTNKIRAAHGTLDCRAFSFVCVALFLFLSVALLSVALLSVAVFSLSVAFFPLSVSGSILSVAVLSPAVIHLHRLAVVVVEGLLLVVVGSTTSSATLRSAAALLQPFDKASVATTASVGGERGRKMPKLESISLLWLHEGSSHRPCSCGSVVVRWRTIAAVSGAGALVSATRAAVDIVI